MSDVSPASVVVEAAPGATGDAVVPAPAPTSTPVDFADLTALLKHTLAKIVEVELQGELGLDEKIKKVAELVKADIRAADLPLPIRTAAMDWVNDALPHVIKAVDLVKSELKKAALGEVEKLKTAALAEVKKCCPTFFTKKV